MVFEQLVKARWIEQRPLYAFLFGAFYTLLGVISAYAIFPEENVGMMSLGFISILLIPTLNQLLSIEESEDVRENKLSLKLLFKDHFDIIEIYAYIFLGILLTFAALAILLPDLTINQLFSSQLRPRFGDVGQAVYGLKTFWSILSNNFVVMLIALVLSLVYGAGSIMFLTWNASVWGVIFGTIARQAAVVVHQHPIVYFGILFVKVFPHMIVEAGAYFFAVIAGGVISKAIIKEKDNARRFNHVFTDGLMFFGMAILLLIIGAWLETYVFPHIPF